MDYIKITVEAHGSRYTAEISDECDVYECLDAMLKLMELMTFTRTSIENAIIDKFHQIDK